MKPKEKAKSHQVKIESELEDAREMVRRKEKQLRDYLNRPPGCICDPGAWRDPGNIPLVCSTFVEDPWGDCQECGHLAACHKPATEGSALVTHLPDVALKKTREKIKDSLRRHGLVKPATEGDSDE